MKYVSGLVCIWHFLLLVCVCSLLCTVCMYLCFAKYIKEFCLHISAHVYQCSNVRVIMCLCNPLLLLINLYSCYGFAS